MTSSDEAPAPSQESLLRDLIVLLEKDPAALQQLKKSLEAVPPPDEPMPGPTRAAIHPPSPTAPHAAQVKRPPVPARVVSSPAAREPQPLQPPPEIKPLVVESAPESTNPPIGEEWIQLPAAGVQSKLWERIGGGALTFATLFHLILLIVGAFWIFQVIHEPEKKVDFLPGGGSAGGGERAAQTKVQQKKRAQITPTNKVKRVFAEGASSRFAMPDQGDDFGEMNLLGTLPNSGMSGGLGGSGSGGGFGSGHGSGNGFGLGHGTGKMFGLIPETMRKRCSKDDRLQRLKDNGGTPACEEAVLRALRWLKANQQADGSWGGGNKPAMTGLALLAYFGHCETPVSEEFGDSCLKGIVYLVDIGLRNNGRIASEFSSNHWPYEHAIATYALAEALTFCRDLKVNVPNLENITQKAGQFIIENQNRNGGWSYLYAKSDGHVDLSVTGWQIQALKACSHRSVLFSGMNTCINKALKYANSCQHDSGGFGYTGKDPAGGGGYHTLTGVGMLCNQMWDKGNTRDIRKAADYVLANTRFDYNSEFSDLYGHYYESQAMMQFGGEHWAKYNALFRDQLLNNQEADGSWRQPGGGRQIRGVATEYFANPVYRTALCALMLEVYYRFLSTGGGSRRGGI